MACFSVGSSRRNTASRLVRVTKLSIKILRKEHLLHLVPCWRPGYRPSIRMAKEVYLSFGMVQLWPVVLSSSVLPFDLSPSPTEVVAVVLVVNNALVWKTLP